MPSFRNRIRRNRSLNTSDIFHDDDAIKYAVGDSDLAENSVYWCDFPVRLMHLGTLRSTKNWNSPASHLQRLLTLFKRVSIVDLSVFKLVYTTNVTLDSLAYEMMSSRETRTYERLRMAKNTPAPSWGITQRTFYKYGCTELSQDAFPWVPDSCRRTDSGMRDASLEGNICCIGRSGGRPIRLALMSLTVSAILFCLYLASTILYLLIFSAARLAFHHEFSLTGRQPTLTPLGFRHAVGICIVNFLGWSVVSFISGILWIEWKRPECLKIIERECADQTALWEQESNQSGVVRTLSLLKHEDYCGSTDILNGRTRLYNSTEAKGKPCSRFVKMMKRIFSGNTLYAVRFCEYPVEYANKCTIHGTMKEEIQQNHQSADDKSIPNLLKKNDSDDTPDYDDYDLSVMPIVMVPPIHSQVTQFSIFGNQFVVPIV